MSKTYGRIGAALIACLVCSTLQAQSSRQVIGRWTDNLGSYWKQEITIVKEKARVYRLSEFHDGSSNRSELVELKAQPGEKRRFKDLGGSHGEFYVINTKGNLDLYDKEGFIRTAVKTNS